MGTYDSLRGLPLVVDSCRFEGLELATAGGFLRKTTVVRLAGAGCEGAGEDVTYEREDQELQQAAGPPAGLAGTFTLASFSEHLATLELFPPDPRGDSPRSAASRDYRRWAYESAALDLALRQAGSSLAARLERELRPVRFVASMGLGRPPGLGPLYALRARIADLRFKLDWSDAWTGDLLARLAELDAVAVVDLKGHYRGTVVDQPPDPAGYADVARLLPKVWIEDPWLTDETAAALADARERITWDAPIHSVADVEALPFRPRALNVKPSRFGSVRRLCDALDHCARHGIACYGGGQFELGPGRCQIQLLASLFYPDADNDVAPTAYHAPQAAEVLPASPLEPPRPAPAGFRAFADG